ncbi:GNAT family N-acetyltransferase [Acaryochloris sp. CCMEE 5410]|uniref:GNAT family N-acetyltransferase n=1 Tax=Acaryochloris sp. CCMEE 5410 TaxID=310037 RepID=UPI0002484095|nr:GNAT family N-acetyltransferase [Acaryochloris sp. CCMEE 5410]KAI9131731.1 GNAT family N-acetyltransferase [Acaryochloris sp. CCMEE 5410]
MTVTIRLLQPDQIHVLDCVAPDVFDYPLNRAWSAAFMADPRHHIAVACDDQRVVGMASAVTYFHPDKPMQLWINEVGVSPRYQRQGIGRQLLQALFTLGRELGCQEAWVGTEADNIPACRLYESVAGTAEDFVMYSFNLAKEQDRASSQNQI